MRSIKRPLALWHIFSIVGIAAIAMPVAARVYLPAKAAVNEQRVRLDQHIGNHNEAVTKDGKEPIASKRCPTVRQGARRLQDDYYERRRQHWERRLDNRLDEEENGDENDNDFADEDVDKQQDVYERRREYYRDRLDEDW
jgi:hypothetical protein